MKKIKRIPIYILNPQLSTARRAAKVPLECSFQLSGKARKSVVWKAPPKSVRYFPVQNGRYEVRRCESGVAGVALLD